MKRMKKPILVRALPGYRLHLKYDDGVQGAVDLSEYAGKGPFAPWSDEAFLNVWKLGRIEKFAGVMRLNFVRTRCI